jgi:hypothetical protein
VKKRTEISIEIDELVVVSAARTVVPRPPCPVCAGSAMVTPEAAAALARVTVRSIYARVEAGGVHFLETPDGLLLLCANSLGQRKPFGELKKLVGSMDTGAVTPTEKE